MKKYFEEIDKIRNATTKSKFQTALIIRFEFFETLTNDFDRAKENFVNATKDQKETLYIAKNLCKIETIKILKYIQSQNRNYKIF